MLCPRCQRTVDPTAAFCGNCGYYLTPTAIAPQPAPSADQTPQQQTPEQFSPPPQTFQAAPPPAPIVTPPAYQQPLQAASPMMPPQLPVATADHSGKAVASLVLGVLGLPATLIPVAGLVFGILAIIFGTLSIHSKRKMFAIIGMSLAVVVLLISIFFWVRNTQHFLQNHKNGGSVVSSNDNRQLQAITTPCYTTKVPAELKITMTEGSCTFLASNAQNGEQEEVKILQVPGLTLANLASAAKADAANVVNSIPGGSIAGQRSATFAESQAYEIEIRATDGSAGLISYVYDTTAQGNLAIILHTQARASGTNYDLSSIEANWSWL
jgi:hypothetical protein